MRIKSVAGYNWPLKFTCSCGIEYEIDSPEDIVRSKVCTYSQPYALEPDISYRYTFTCPYCNKKVEISKIDIPEAFFKHLKISSI